MANVRTYDIDMTRIAVRHNRIANLELGARYSGPIDAEQVGAVTMSLEARGLRESATLVRSLWAETVKGRQARARLAVAEGRWWWRLFAGNLKEKGQK